MPGFIDYGCKKVKTQECSVDVFIGNALATGKFKSITSDNGLEFATFALLE